MSPQPGPAPAGEPTADGSVGMLADHGSAGARGSVFALPARTSFRFADNFQVRVGGQYLAQARPGRGFIVGD